MSKFSVITGEPILEVEDIGNSQKVVLFRLPKKVFHLLLSGLIIVLILLYSIILEDCMVNLSQ